MQDAVESFTAGVRANFDRSIRIEIELSLLSSRNW